jgi:DNA-binding PadR family transcriptional regulator
MSERFIPAPLTAERVAGISDALSRLESMGLAESSINPVTGEKEYRITDLGIEIGEELSQ